MSYNSFRIFLSQKHKSNTSHSSSIFPPSPGAGICPVCAQPALFFFRLGPWGCPRSCPGSVQALFFLRPRGRTITHFSSSFFFGLVRLLGRPHNLPLCTIDLQGYSQDVFVIQTADVPLARKLYWVLARPGGPLSPFAASMVVIFLWQQFLICIMLQSKIVIIHFSNFSYLGV